MSKSKILINELLVDVFNRILSIEEEYMRRIGCRLSLNEVHILEAIRNTEEPNMGQIARKLGVTTGTLTIAVSRLVQKKCLSRLAASEDRRKVLLELTDYGKSVLKLHDQFHDEMVDSLLTEYQIEQDETLIKSLEKIVKFFKEKYESFN